MEAGSDTTASTLLSYLLGMISNPAAYARARHELDSVCGTERSPAAEDLERLPYLRACMTEVGCTNAKNFEQALAYPYPTQTLRWRPVAPGGIPHLLIQDDYYQGYHLPKGTIVFANAWSIHRDQEEYSAGDEFRPERFLNNPFGTQQDGDGANDHRRTTYAFGAGRRVCPGQRLAENSLVRPILCYRCLYTIG
jgi:cytochrome P450